MYLHCNSFCVRESEMNDLIGREETDKDILMRVISRIEKEVIRFNDPECLPFWEQGSRRVCGGGQY